MHYFNQKGVQLRQNCFVDLQSDNFFEIARTDVDLIVKGGM